MREDNVDHRDRNQRPIDAHRDESRRPSDTKKADAGATPTIVTMRAAGRTCIRQKMQPITVIAKKKAICPWA